MPENENIDIKITRLETNFSNFDNDLKDIKIAITRSTAWLVTTLLTVIVASFSIAFWLGSWKGGIEEKIQTIEKNQRQNTADISTAKETLRPVIREEIDNFAKHNFNTYNK